eukprot:15403078-Heterocapsa_arctica.AAC.1
MSCHCPFILDALKGVEKRSIKAPAAAAKVVHPDPQPAASSSSRHSKPFSPYQIAKAAQGSKAPRTGSPDTSGTIKRVMIYMWKWDHEKTAAQLAQYARDGCTRWYPGFNFVAPWTYGVDDDPGRAGFIKQHEEIFKHDDTACETRHSNLMIGLMADDIEASEGYDPNAERQPDEMVHNELFRNCIAARHVQFFGTPNPSDALMYTKRNMLAAE